MSENTNSQTIGYARVSTNHQRFDLQMEALEAAGATRIFSDMCSGSKPALSRSGFQECCDYLRSGDLLVVYRLDRVARSVTDLLNTVEFLQNERNVGFRSTSEDLDFTTPTGRFSLAVLGAVASMERDLIRSRVRDGIAASNLRSGRPPVPVAKIQSVRQLHEQGVPVSQIRQSVGLARSTVYRIIKDTPAGAGRV